MASLVLRRGCIPWCDACHPRDTGSAVALSWCDLLGLLYSELLSTIVANIREQLSLRSVLSIPKATCGPCPCLSQQKSGGLYSEEGGRDDGRASAFQRDRGTESSSATDVGWSSAEHGQHTFSETLTTWSLHC